jgi:hypothetical protein
MPLFLKTRFDHVGVGGRQRVLGGQSPKGPTGGLLGGLKAVEFRPGAPAAPPPTDRRPGRASPGGQMASLPRAAPGRVAHD